MSITIDTTLAMTQDHYDTAPAKKPSLILVVEDSADIRDLLAELLEGEGYRLLFATKGEEGLASANAHHPQLILMDLSLPGMDGWEAVRQLRKKEKGLQVPIIAMSAHASEHTRCRALEVGCNDYIRKPFDTDQLLEVVARYINSLEPTN